MSTIYKLHDCAIYLLQMNSQQMRKECKHNNYTNTTRTESSLHGAFETMMTRHHPDLPTAERVMIMFLPQRAERDTHSTYRRAERKDCITVQRLSVVL